MNLIQALAFFLASAVAAVAAPQKAVNPETIKDAVRITLNKELTVQFKAEGDRLIEPKNLDGAGDKRGTVKIRLKVTDSTPFRVRGVATRPYLVVEHGFEKTLRCRALARLKGSKEFFEVSDAVKPMPPGEQSLMCWESGNLIEEVLLYHFTLSKDPAK